MADLSFKTVAIAGLTGTIPSLIWLWFWWKEEQGNSPKSLGLIAISFLIGMTGVLLVIPLEKIAQAHISSQNILIFVWAGMEELIKYGAISVIALKSIRSTKPIDFPVFFITTALGFAALENTLFLLQPEMVQDSIVSFLTGNFRFLGATLLHTVASGMIGIAVGLAFYKGHFAKAVYAIFGLATAISLHAAFNLFIMNSSKEKYFTVFGLLWVVTIISMLLFEKLRRMSNIVS